MVFKIRFSKWVQVTYLNHLMVEGAAAFRPSEPSLAQPTQPHILLQENKTAHQGALFEKDSTVAPPLEEGPCSFFTL